MFTVRDNPRWQLGASLFLIALILTLFFIASFTRSSIYIGYIRDTAEAEKQCESKETAAQNEKSEKCEGVLYRALSDPVALFTGILDIFTLALFVATYLLFVAAVRDREEVEQSIAIARDSANASLVSAKTATNALIASHRAWIRPHISIDEDLHFTNLSVSIGVGIKLENIGNAPAQTIDCQVWLIPRFILIENMSGRPTVEDRHKSNCAASKDSRSLHHGFMLFPGEVFPEAQNLGKFAIIAYLDRCNFEDAIVNRQGKDVIVLYIGGAINYRFPSDSKIHQTSFLYEITYKGIPSSFDINIENYAMADLRLAGVAINDGRQAD